jgi:hypothetical protein
MRLINVDTMKLEERIGEIEVNYLILSHTWTDEEISYQDYMWLQNHEEEVTDGIIDELPPRQRARTIAKAESLRQRVGYRKVFHFIRSARRLHKEHCKDHYSRLAGAGLQPIYVWVDTCCINKESSAELSEAINSMFNWYTRADICVAILSDVTVLDVDPKGEFGKSRWFTRGWTLQELLAPPEVAFYNQKDEFIGYRSAICNQLEAITAINAQYLGGFWERADFWSATVAQKMSWAAKRETTRIEDEAYCLLGIFNVNMPLLFGEGRHAFIRLQQNIIDDFHDQSIFAWGYNTHLGANYCTGLSVYADNPTAFGNCGSLILPDDDQNQLNPQGGHPFERTNMGLRITLDLFQLTEGMGMIYALLPVRCEEAGSRICVPVIWRATHGRIQEIPHGAVLATYRNEPPVAFSYDLETLRRMMPAVAYARRSVILSSESLNDDRIQQRLGFVPPHFTLTLLVDGDTRVLEGWCPNMRYHMITQETPSPAMEPLLQVTSYLRFQGSSEHHRQSPWPFFVRVSPYKNGTRGTEEYLIVISFSIYPTSIRWVKVFDWRVIALLTFPRVASLLDLYVSSLQPGGMAMRSAPWPEVRASDSLPFSVDWEDRIPGVDRGPDLRVTLRRSDAVAAPLS